MKTKHRKGKIYVLKPSTPPPARATVKCSAKVLQVVFKHGQPRFSNMANLILFPARNSSLPLIIIFLLLNSLLNQLHSSSYEESEGTDEIEEEGRLEKSLEPKFALHKWAHGYTCSYRFNFTALWCIFVSPPKVFFVLLTLLYLLQGPSACVCRLSGQASVVAMRW